MPVDTEDDPVGMWTVAESNTAWLGLVEASDTVSGEVRVRVVPSESAAETVIVAFWPALLIEARLTTNLGMLIRTGTAAAGFTPVAVAVTLAVPTPTPVTAK